MELSSTDDQPKLKSPQTLRTRRCTHKFQIKTTTNKKEINNVCKCSNYLSRQPAVFGLQEQLFAPYRHSTEATNIAYVT